MKHFRKIPFLLPLLLCFYGHSIFAESGENFRLKVQEKALDKQLFEQLQNEILTQPSVLSHSPNLIRQLSSEQLQTLIASMNLSHHGFLYPVRIKGKNLTELLGRDTRELFLMSAWGGRLQAIPFQFDEYDNKSGYIHIDGVNPFPLDGRRYFFDGSDELVFMYRDAGEERFQLDIEQQAGYRIEHEIAFKDYEGRKRYVYVVSGLEQKAQSQSRYINASMEDGSIISSFYSMRYNPENLLELEDMRPHVGLASDERVVDMIYFKMSANVFSRFIKISMNSHDNIRLRVLGVKNGPVRSVLFLKISVLAAGIPVFSMFSEMNVYEQGIVMPNRAEVGKGFLFTRIFKNPEIVVFLDMHGLKNGRVSADAFADERGRLRYGLIDGKMDEVEQQANALRAPGEWIWLNSGLGWDVFMTLSFPEDKFEGMTTSLYYKDSKKHLTKGETFPGAEPRLGMRINGLPKNIKKLENLDLEYAFWYPDTVGEGGPRKFYQQVSNPPTFVIKSLQQ